jgi:hypothetical protein
MEDTYMSYKFQRGAAVLSGSITAEDGLDAGDSGLASAGAVAGATTIDAAGLASLDGGINVNDTFAVATDGAVTGVTTLAMSSTLTSTSNIILDSDGARITLGDDQEVFIEHIADQGIKLRATGSNGATSPTKFLMEFSSSSPAADDQVGLIQMDGYDDAGNAQTWAKIQAVSTDVTHGTEDSSLTFSVATSGSVNAGLILSSEGTDGVIDATVGLGAASTVTIPGNLTVNGTTTTINTANMVVTSSIYFEGTTPDPHEVILTAANATVADKTITLPDLTGHVPLLAGAIGNANVTAAEFGVLDGGSLLNTGLTVDDSLDGFLMNDGGVMKHIRADNLKTYFQTGVSADSAGGFTYNQYNSTSSVIHNPNGTSGFLVASGSTTLNPLSASVPTSINLSGSWENGMVLYIKAPSNASDWNLTINASGSDRIDGEESIVLESDYAAVTLLRCHSSRWSIV